MRTNDVLVMPPMTRHAVLTVWQKDTSLRHQWCVLGGRNFATQEDIEFCGSLMNSMGTGGTRCNAQGPNGWSKPWAHLWEQYITLNPDAASVEDIPTRVQLLRGADPAAPPPPPIGKKRKRKQVLMANLAAANRKNPKHNKPNK
jgi:hypothetical protein